MRKEVFPASTLMNTSTEPIRSMFSVVIVKGYVIEELKILKCRLPAKKIPVVQAGIVKSYKTQVLNYCPV